MSRESVQAERRQFLRQTPRAMKQIMLSLIRDSMSFFMPESGQEKANNQIGTSVAFLDVGSCLAWGGMNCQLCYLACPLRDRALEIRDQKPVMVAEICDGCGLCEKACLTVNEPPSIRMVLQRNVRHAKEVSEP